jgi:hypothetical protein
VFFFSNLCFWPVVDKSITLFGYGLADYELFKVRFSLDSYFQSNCKWWQYKSWQEFILYCRHKDVHLLLQGSKADTKIRSKTKGLLAVARLDLICVMVGFGKTD